MLIAAMRRYSIAAAEAQSVTGLAETGQLVPTSALEVESDDDDAEVIVAEGIIIFLLIFIGYLLYVVLGKIVFQKKTIFFLIFFDF